MDMNWQQNFNNRLTCVQINDFSRIKIGKNSILNRLGVLNNEIKYTWLNLSLNSFKIKTKSLFLKKLTMTDN